MNKPLVNTADRNFARYCIAVDALKQVLLQFIKKQCKEHCYWNLEYIKSTCGVSEHTCGDCNLSPSCQNGASSSRCAQNGACDVLFQRIKSQHLTQHPNWSNVRWELLSSSPWQQMKSFITESGYKDVASEEDSGITAFVQICCNHCDVSQLVGEDIRALQKIVEIQDRIFQSEAVRYTAEEMNRHIQDIKSALQIHSLNSTPDIQDHLDVLDKLLREERSIEIEDEILARLHVIANLNRSIASLEHGRAEAEASPNDRKIRDLSFIKQKHCHRLKTRFEEVNSCLTQQKQDCKKEEDTLLKYRTEAEKLGLNIPLQSSAVVWKSTRASNDSNNMYMHSVHNGMVALVDDVKEVLNGVDKNGRSINAIEEVLRNFHSLIRGNIAITQLEHGNIPDLLTKITTVGASNNEALSGEIVEAGNGLLNGVQFTDSHRTQLQNALRHVLQSLEQDGNVVTRIGHGCMAIYICCPTVTNLIALCEDFLSGKLTLLFKPLEDYLRTLPGRGDVAVEVNIFEKDYLNCIMPVINAVKHKLDLRLQALVSTAFGRNNVLQRTSIRAETHQVEILKDEGNTTIKTETMSKYETEDGLKDSDTNGGIPANCEDYGMAFKVNSGLNEHTLKNEDVKPLGCLMAKQEEDILKILIATGSHLGFAEKDPVRGNDSLVTFEEILENARKHEVDFVLLGGDLFHANKPSRRIVHETTALLRNYCLGDKPVQFKVLSDPLTTFEHCKFPGLNYEDPNLKIAIPVFSIHGKHDDPAGQGHLCALDILHTVGYVNYFGKTKSIDEIKLSPLLFQKGSTKVALYGLGAVSDERLHRMFMKNKVTMLRPQDNCEEWFNMLVLHQKRSHHGQANHIPEHFLDEFVDLVLWGHEHECRIEPERFGVQGFHVTQPGSSIATSLSASETGPKYCGLLEIKSNHFEITKIRLETARQFYSEDIVLKETLLDPLDHDIGKKGPQLLQEKGRSIARTSRFGQLFVDRVANPKDMIHFMRKKGMAANKQDGVDGELGDIHVSAACIEDMVNEYFSQADDKLKLQVLSEKCIGMAFKELVVKDERDAIPKLVANQLRKIQDHLKEQSTNEDIEVIDKEINCFKKERDLSEKEYAGMKAILEPRAKYRKNETLETLSEDIDMKSENSDKMRHPKSPALGVLEVGMNVAFKRERGSRGGKGKTSITRSCRGKRGGRERKAVVVDMKRSTIDSFLMEPSASGKQIPSVRSFSRSR